MFVFVCTPQAEGLKDINWQLISWIKESQQNLNPQNHADVTSKPNAKPATSTKSQTHTRAEEDSKPKNKKHYNSRTPPAQPEFSDANPEAKPAPVTQHASRKPASKANTETGNQNQKPLGDNHLSKSTKAQSSLHVESMEVTPRNKDATFTDRPKVKTKTSHEKKSESRKSAKRSSLGKKDRKQAAAKTATMVVEEKKEAEPVRPSSPPPKNSITVTPTPSKTSKKSRGRSPPTDRKCKSTPSKSTADVPLALVVKIQLNQLSRVPQVSKTTKTRTNAHVETPLKKQSQEKDPGKAAKKRPVSFALPDLCFCLSRDVRGCKLYLVYGFTVTDCCCFTSDLHNRSSI